MPDAGKVYFEKIFRGVKPDARGFIGTPNAISGELVYIYCAVIEEFGNPKDKKAILDIIQALSASADKCIFETAQAYRGSGKPVMPMRQETDKSSSNMKSFSDLNMEALKRALSKNFTLENFKTHTPEKYHELLPVFLRLLKKLILKNARADARYPEMGLHKASNQIRFLKKAVRDTNAPKYYQGYEDVRLRLSDRLQEALVRHIQKSISRFNRAHSSTLILKDDWVSTKKIWVKSQKTMPRAKPPEVKEPPKFKFLEVITRFFKGK